jgi:hypothetical protein
MPIGEQIADIARNDVVASAVKTAPPVSVVGATLLGYPMANWVMALTIIYTSLQIAVLVRDKFWPRIRKQKKE